MKKLYHDLVEEMMRISTGVSHEEVVAAVTRVVRKNIYESRWHLPIIPCRNEMELRKKRAFELNGTHAAEIFSNCERDEHGRLRYKLWIVRP